MVDRSDFVRARAVAFDENRLPVSKDMDFFDKRIAGAAETVTIRAQQNTACIVSIRQMSLRSAASLRCADQALTLMLVGCMRRCAAWVARPHGRRDAPGPRSRCGSHTCVHRSSRISSWGETEAGRAVGLAPGRRDGRCAPRYGRLNASFRSPAHLIASRGARGAYAHTRWNACARRAGTPPFQPATWTLPRAAAREPVARAARTSWSRVRLGARASSRSRP